MEERIELLNLLSEDYPVNEYFSEINEAIISSLNSKNAVRLPYECAPVSPKNLKIAMKYYCPENESGFSYNFIFNEINPRYRKLSFNDDYNTNQKYGLISKKLTRLLGDYPKANMDVVEDHIRKTMLYFPFAVQEFSAKFFSGGSTHSTNDYIKMGGSGVLNLILAANIDNWITADNPNYDLNLDLITWLRKKLNKLEEKADYGMGFKTTGLVKVLVIKG